MLLRSTLLAAFVFLLFVISAPAKEALNNHDLISSKNFNFIRGG